MLSDFEFLWWWLFAALPLPLLVLFIRRLGSNAHQPEALQVPFLQRIEQAMRASGGGLAPRPGWSWWRALPAWLLWLLLLSAAARPVSYGEAMSLERSGRDLMLAVDVSGSMETVDMQFEGVNLTRLAAVQAVLDQFIEKRVGDRIGLILFGTQAYVQAPLTFDNVTVRQFLREASIGLAGEKTAIGDAIGLSLKRLNDDNSDRVLILLTDGVNTAGAVDPREAAGWAQEQGMKIYTIGFGADSMLVQSIFGQRRVNPSAELDEELLRQIATLTGGEYFRARSAEQLQQIYSYLDEIKKRSDQDAYYRPRYPLQQYPLTAALIVVALLVLWRSGGKGGSHIDEQR